jgi:hypothetical protein
MIDIGASVARLERDVAKANHTIDGFAKSAKAAFSMIGIGFGATSVKAIFDMGLAAAHTAQSFNMMAKSASVNADALLRSMKDASAGAVQETELMAGAVKGFMHDLSSDAIVELTAAARTAGRMAGVTTQEAFNEIVKAVGAGEAEALKKFGLISKEQMDLFAKAVASGSKEVALLDIALANAARQQEKFGENMKSDAERVQELNARFQELITSISVGFKSAIFGAVDGWKQFGEAAKEAIDPYKELTEAQFGYAGKGAWMPAVSDQRPASESTEAKWIGRVPKTPRADIAELESQLRAAAGKKQVEAERDKWLAGYLDGVDRAMKAEQERSELVGQLYIMDWQWIIEKNDKQLAAEQEYAKQLEEIKVARLEAEADARESAIRQEEEAARKVSGLWAYTAELMQDNFSSLFLDVMQGKLNSFENFAKRIFQSIQQAAADMLSQAAVQALFGQAGKGGGLLSSIFEGFSLLGSATGGAAAASSAFTAAEMASMVWLHGGGEVGPNSPRRMMPSYLMAEAPRLHSGLMGDEYPAILQKGEHVIPKSEAVGGGGKAHTVNVYINAIDSASLNETMSRNPNAILAPFLTALNQGGQVRNAIRNVM